MSTTFLKTICSVKNFLNWLFLSIFSAPSSKFQILYFLLIYKYPYIREFHKLLNKIYHSGQLRSSHYLHYKLIIKNRILFLCQKWLLKDLINVINFFIRSSFISLSAFSNNKAKSSNNSSCLYSADFIIFSLLLSNQNNII